MKRRKIGLDDADRLQLQATLKSLFPENININLSLNVYKTTIALKFIIKECDFDILKQLYNISHTINLTEKKDWFEIDLSIGYDIETYNMISSIIDPYLVTNRLKKTEFTKKLNNLNSNFIKLINELDKNYVILNGLLIKLLYYDSATENDIKICNDLYKRYLKLNAVIKETNIE